MTIQLHREDCPRRATGLDGAIAADALADDDPLGWLVSGSVDSVITAGYRFATRPSTPC